MLNSTHHSSITTEEPCERKRTYTVLYSNEAAPTDIYSLSLHDALPIWSDLRGWEPKVQCEPLRTCWVCGCGPPSNSHPHRAGELTPPLQSRVQLVGMRLARRAQQEDPEPDWRRL